MKTRSNRPGQADELRLRAEKLARKNADQSPENSEALSIDKTRRMLHELRVHQIELEMQNEELRRAQSEQDAARARYFDLYDLAPVGYCTLSEKGLIMETNLTVATLIGTARSTLVRRPLSRFIHKEDLDIFYRHCKMLIETGMEQHCELRMMRSGGTHFWVQLNSTVTNDAKGAAAFRTVIVDITARIQADETLRKGQKLSSIGLLVAAIAHEINNPNGFILFNIPILREYLQELIPIVDLHMQDDPRCKLFGRCYEDFRKDLFNLLDNIEHGTQRINAIVSALKDFFRKQKNLDIRRFDLKQLIDRAVSICQHDLRQKVKSLHIDIPGNLPPVWSDPDAIELILANLLINAAHTSDKKDPWIKLRVTVDENNPDRRTIAIIDNGCGMDEQSMKKIFDPFYADKSPMKGIDLGLYICQSLAENLGCRIEVESRKNQGSCFRVILNDQSRKNRVFLNEGP